MDWDAHGLALWISLKIAFYSVLVILPPGVLAAWLLARKQFLGKSFFEALVYAPLVLPPVVSGYLLLLVFGSQGLIGRWLAESFGLQLAFGFGGAVLAAALVAFPLLVRTLRLSFEWVDPGLEVAAATLGAGPWRVFFTITLPLAKFGLVTGILLAFVRGLGEFGATITFAGNIEGETRGLPLAVYTYLQTPGKEAEVWVLATISIAISLAALIFSEWWTRTQKQRQRSRP